MLIDKLAHELGAQVKRDECRALVGRGQIDNTTVELAKPQTFMNLSGESVACLVKKETRSPDRLIVISDDLALPFGRIRIRPKGSHGGQNGLRSIIERLGTNEFIRVRVGIQPEHPVSSATGFVLERFSAKDLETVDSILDEAASAVRTIVTDGVEAAMARFNGEQASSSDETAPADVEG
jgi:PTH1 family peptidyl-tRNA hydrolase